MNDLCVDGTRVSTDRQKGSDRWALPESFRKKAFFRCNFEKSLQSITKMGYNAARVSGIVFAWT
jgi:hypothetical protein